MNKIPEDIINETLKIGGRLAGSQLSVDLARLYSQKTRIHTGQKGLRTWHADEAFQRLQDAETLIEIAFLHREQDLKTWRKYWQRAAEILEWLADANASPPNVPIAFLSAAVYQLAGYPARALGVINEMSDADDHSSILKAFIKGDFRELQNKVHNFWKHNLLFHEDMQKKAPLEDVVIGETISALGVQTSWFRWGDGRRLTKTIKKLESISKILLYSKDAYSWLLARMVSEISKEFINASLRQNLGKILTRVNESGADAVERYLRLSFLERAVLAWPSQLDGIKNLESDSSFALCTPTGSGKTRIAELAILDSLFNLQNEEDENPIVLYLVPSKALAVEVEVKMARVLRRIGEEQIAVTSLYGGSDWGASDSFLTYDQRMVLIATHEKTKALIRFLGHSFIDRIKLIIIDEAHGVEYIGDRENLKDAKSRSLHLETLVSRLFTRLETKRCRIIALSAVAAGIENDLACWITRTPDATAVITNYRSTRQLIGRLLCRPNGSSEIRYDLLDGQQLVVQTGNEDVSPYIPEPFPSHPPAPGIKGEEKKLRPQLLWAAMHLAARDSSGKYHSVLISVPQQPGGYADDFLNLFDNLWKDQHLPDFFNNERVNNNKFNRCLESCEDYFGNDSREYKLLLHGIVLHHGKMPGIMSRLLIELIQDRVVNIVIATSTLTEGVNLPFEVVLIPTLRRINTYLTSREFLNLIGRAGRPGVSTEGRSLVLMDHSGRSKTAKAYGTIIRDLISATSAEVSPIKNRGPLGQLLIYIHEKLKEINPNMSNREFVSWLESTDCGDDWKDLDEATTALDTLDGIILEAIEEAEEQSSDVIEGVKLEDLLRRMWQKTFSYYSTTQKKELENIFIIRGKSLIEKIYTMPENRRLLYKASLPPREGKILIRSLDGIKSQLKASTEYYSWTSPERVANLASLIDSVSSIPSFSIKRSGKLGEHWQKILSWWLDPVNAFAKPTPKEISNWYDYSAQNFSYRFNWGLGSIFGLILSHGPVEKNTFERWEDTSMPWSVFWIKDMIIWGLLDPVATYLLIYGFAETRKDALLIASQYYEKFKTVKSDLLFDPRKIAKWASGVFKKEHISKTLEELTVPVQLLDKAEKYSELSYHVWPIHRDSTIIWIDPSGYLLAKCEMPRDWKDYDINQYDFTLRTRHSSEVIVKRYL